MFATRVGFPFLVIFINMEKKLITELSRIKTLMKINEELSDDDISTVGNELEMMLNKPIAQFVDDFASVANNPKVLAVLKAGLEDGDMVDDKIKIGGEGRTPVKNMIPTQNEIGAKESLLNILTDKYGSLASFLDGDANVGDNPIVIYNNKYIIDGHHRWSQVFAANPEATVPTLNLQGSLGAADVLKIVHLSIAAGANKLPLSSAEGENLLKASPDDVFKYVTQNLDEKTAKIWGAKRGVKNKKELASLIVKNVKQLQKNGTMDGAPPRTKMPQTDAVETTSQVINRLGKGVVNFNNPSSVVGNKSPNA